MTMRKKIDQEIFISRCYGITCALKDVAQKGYFGLINWTEFLETYTHHVERLTKLFKELGL